jgi:hypothetical protein
MDLLTIARKAQASVQMVERFNAKRLTAETNVENLQSLKPTEVPER